MMMGQQPGGARFGASSFPQVGLPQGSAQAHAQAQAQAQAAQAQAAQAQAQAALRQQMARAAPYPQSQAPEWRATVVGAAPGQAASRPPGRPQLDPTGRPSPSVTVGSPARALSLSGSFGSEAGLSYLGDTAGELFGAAEEFPALAGGHAPPGLPSASLYDASHASFRASSPQPPSQQAQAAPPLRASGAMSRPPSVIAPKAPLPSAPLQVSLQPSSSLPSGTSEDPYGLLGLLQVLKNRELSTLASGTDLTTLGLNLSAADMLYPSFASPFADAPLKREAEFQIPSCYLIRPPLPPPTDKMSLFSDETLFYIFYSMPGDSMQLAAAQELQARDWTYHLELKVWFQRLPGSAQQKNAQGETGSYLYFDVRAWEKKRKLNFRMEYDKLLSK